MQPPEPSILGILERCVKNEATAPNSEEIANAIASAGRRDHACGSRDGALKAEQAINDNGLRWTGALNDSTQKYSIEVNGDTLVFKIPMAARLLRIR